MLVINGKLRANTSLLGAFTNCGVHARHDEKPDATKGAHVNQRFEILLFTRHLRGQSYNGVVVEAIEV